MNALRSGITVIIPTYKRVQELDRCLRAIERQSLRPVEVLLTYRLEDEETCAYLARADRPAKDARLLVCDQPGVVYALTLAFDNVRTEYLALTDDDSEPHSDWLERIVACFASDPRAAGVGGKDHVYADGAWMEGEAPVVGLVRWNGSLIGNHHIGVGPARYVHALKGVNMALRVSALDGLRPDPRLRGTGAQVGWELHLSLTLIGRGYKLVYDPAILVEHFIGSRTMDEHRVQFHPRSYSDAHYNVALTLLEYLRTQRWGRARQAAFLAFNWLRGSRRSPGLLLLAVGLLTRYPHAWERFRTTFAASWEAARTARS